MSLRSLLQNFSSTNVELDPYDRDPEISEDIQQVLAYLMGRHLPSDMWKMLACDTDGRLLVSTSATQAESAVNSAVTVNNADSAVLASNVNRKQYAIYNNGANTVYLTFGSPAVLATGFPLLPGGVWADDQYVGIIRGITAAGNSELRVVEM